ncbi:MAG: ChbG/HpnK family deacetylase [Gammaproteobacteria bacterium]|nr:ChbG/HpnK family deacetylase [Gammaproteobacteria bacterium]
MSGELSDSPAIVACVDDFGLSPAVNRSVLSLAREHRISATSCLVNLPDCTPQAMSELPSLDLDLGLHLNFTEGAPLSRRLRNAWPKFPSLGRLLVASHLGRLPVTGVQDECRAQLERFVQLVGRAPDFVDGHQHVHHLPVIRDAWLVALGSRGPRLYVRDTASLRGPGWAIKRLLIRGTGARALQRQLRQQNLLAGGPLFGTYDLRPRNYRTAMRRWLASLADDGLRRGLLFCHPADIDAAASGGDPIAAARQAEWAYFSSSAWPEDLAEFGIGLARGATLFTIEEVAEFA